MNYNHELWSEYTSDNQSELQLDLSKFIYHITLGLGATSVIEAGCNVGNNLSAFPESFNVTGMDMNKSALEIAQKNFSNFTFYEDDIKATNFPDSHFDVVFTRGVLIHIPQRDLDKTLQEFIRISKKWIFNLEYFGEDGKMINWERGDNLLWYRNMKEQWKKFDVEIMSDFEIPVELDKNKCRFTLVRKI